MPSLLAAALFATSLSAQAASGPPVKLEPVGVENVRLGLTGGSFDVLVEAERMRGIRVKLRSLDYTVKMGGRVVSRGDREYEGKVLKKGAPIIIEIPVEFSAADALSTGLDALSTGKLNARIQGTAGLSVCIFPFKVPFDEKFKLNESKGKKGRKRGNQR